MTDLWRARVRRMAMEFVRADRGEPERFDYRACPTCAKTIAVNPAVYPPDEPVPCCDGEPPIYNPSVKRDGYWYACCVRGVDPEASPGFGIGFLRRRALRKACAEVGLTFGEVST